MPLGLKIYLFSSEIKNGKPVFKKVYGYLPQSCVRCFDEITSSYSRMAIYYIMMLYLRILKIDIEVLT